MSKKKPFTKTELERLSRRVQNFFFILVAMFVLLYVQAKYFPWHEPPTFDKPPSPSGSASTVSPSAASPLPSPTPTGAISFREGDVIFQQSTGELPDVIAAVTQSPITHCGMILLEGDEIMVIEAADGVEKTPLVQWIRRGKDEKFALLRPEKIPAGGITKAVSHANKFIGRPYDLQYEMTDEKIYCSELVYKAYRRGAGVRLGKLQKLGDLKYQGHEGFIRKLTSGTLPLDREMITPVALYETPDLSVIYDDFKLRKGKRNQK